MKNVKRKEEILNTKFWKKNSCEEEKFNKMPHVLSRKVDRI